MLCLHIGRLVSGCSSIGCQGINRFVGGNRPFTNQLSMTCPDGTANSQTDLKPPKSEFDLCSSGYFQFEIEFIILMLDVIFSLLATASLSLSSRSRAHTLLHKS